VHPKLVHVRLKHLRLKHAKLAHPKLVYLRLVHLRLVHLRLVHLRLVHLRLVHLRLVQVTHAFLLAYRIPRRMSTLTKIFYTLIVIPLALYVVPTIFNFFGVDMQTYLIYVIWFIALLLLNAILPARLPNMFTPVK
jgi:hypothetical protein